MQNSLPLMQPEEELVWSLFSETGIALTNVNLAFSHPNSDQTKLRALRSSIFETNNTLQEQLRFLIQTLPHKSPPPHEDGQDCLEKAVRLIQEASQYIKPANIPNSESTLECVNGKWTRTYGGQPLDVAGKRSTAVGRLKRDYDLQVSNILRLELERNSLQLQVLVLENRIRLLSGKR